MTSSAIQIRMGQIEDAGTFACRIRCPFPAVRGSET
jgi:hypothetical protein